MRLQRKFQFGAFLLAAGFIALAALLSPQTASADAGPGGGGGQSGCDAFNYSTCFGAVWRYYYTNSDAYNIPNVNPAVNGNTVVRGCASKGGFFAYVLVSKANPNDGNQHRSWKIGPVDDVSGNRSEFFGGWTKYYLYSNPGDTLPTTLSNGGMYSWYATKNAFDKTVAAGQNNGFTWDGSSQLGWFCYQHINFNLNPVVNVPTRSADPSTTVRVTATVDNMGTTDSTNAEWQLNTFTVAPGGSYPSGDTNGTAPRTYFGNGATEVNSGSGSRVFPANPTITVWDSTRKLGELPIGTKVCFALSVKPASNDNSNWRHSTPDCVIISKKPKVQVLGGDLIVGRGAAASSTKSIVVTSTTTAFRDPTEIDAPASSFSGLYLTGVNASGAPLPANSPDPHWSIDRVYRPSGRSGNTCQSMVVGNSTSSTTVRPILTTSYPSPVPARVITQQSSGAGLYTSQNTNVTGNSVSASVVANENRSVWARTASNARWIGINQYGQNYSRGGCLDPTYDQGANMANANIYVFKLRDGFNISASSLVKLETVRLSLRGGVDNQIRFYVNGKDLGDWQEPGWSAGSSATSTAKGNVFQYGNNSLEIHVRSTYSHTGILIDQLTMTAKALATADRTYGSWTEYGMAPAGAVTGMASGSGFANGALNGALCPSKSLLTFSNVGGTPANSSCDTSALGRYMVSSASPYAAISTRFTPSSGTPALSGTVDIASLQSGRVYQASGNILLNSTGNIPRGKWVVIKAPNNTVTINNNITYTNESLSRVSDLPQVVIIANNITINRGVSRVDSWLLAQGTGVNGALKTCDVSAQSDLTAQICGTRLRINGPVIANRLLLYRTGGAEPGDQSGIPAEVFNLRPDAYLWATDFASSTGRLPTVSTKELPPRF